MSDIVNRDLHNKNLLTHSVLEILPKMPFEASWADIWLLPSQNKPKQTKTTQKAIIQVNHLTVFYSWCYVISFWSLDMHRKQNFGIVSVVLSGTFPSSLTFSIVGVADCLRRFWKLHTVMKFVFMKMVLGDP